MWPGFDPTPYTRATWLAHVAAIKSASMTWKPSGLTFHNTYIPNLAQWKETGDTHSTRLMNLQTLYENTDHWHHGPHAFVSRDWINGFSPLTEVGVHASCFNRDHFGIEMVGNYEAGHDDFNTGDGAKVRDNAVYAAAVLLKHFGIPPTGINFHRDCPRDHHPCPGSLVSGTDMIARVKAAIAALSPISSNPGAT